ncbi:Hsp20/alpha crystallin family protein [Ostertagia ostertagi]
MAICIHPWAGETAILPRLLDDVFSEIDDVFNELAQIEPPIHSVARRKGRKALAGYLGKVTDDGSKLAISLDVSKFKPDELKVQITPAGHSFRRWTLPEDVDVEQIRSTLSENGQLAIEVPKPKPAVTARTIPIQKAVDQQ